MARIQRLSVSIFLYQPQTSRGYSVTLTFLFCLLFNKGYIRNVTECLTAQLQNLLSLLCLLTPSMHGAFNMKRYAVRISCCWTLPSASTQSSLFSTLGPQTPTCPRYTCVCVTTKVNNASQRWFIEHLAMDRVWVLETLDMIPALGEFLCPTREHR